MNVDLDFLIREIDKFNKNEPEKLLMDELKLKLNQRNKKEQNSNTSVNINKEENNNTNKNKSIKEKEKINIKGDDIRTHSETMASTSTADSCLNETNSMFLNNLKDKIAKNKSINKKGFNENNDRKIDNKEKEEIPMNNKRMINNDFNTEKIFGQKSKSEIIYKEMTQTFIDKDEIPSNNIVYQALQKTKIKLIDVNLLLKKIVECDFSKKNYEILYAFIRQSFSFIKKDIFIKKIINCYNHYKRLNLPLNKLENLIYFLNAYTIEMFLYYNAIPSDSKLMKLIINFYNELITENINSIGNMVIYNDINEILKDKICIQTLKISKNSAKEKVKNYSSSEISKKLNNRVSRNKGKIIKCTQLNKEQKFKNDDNKEKPFKTNLQLDEIDDDLEDFEGRKTHFCENSLKIGMLMNNNIYETEVGEGHIHNERLLSGSSYGKQLDEKRSGSAKKSNKKLDICHFEDLTDEKDLIEIIGEEYVDMINNSNLVSNEEKFLYNIKNIIKLLNTKDFKKSDIINKKNYEIFYENFSFYKTKYKENKNNNTHLKKNAGKNKNLNKTLTLNPKELKMNISQNSPKKYFCVEDWDTAQIAETLIHITRKMLNKIEYKELYGALFTKNAKEINSPNVVENIKRFNHLIMFIIEDILSYDFPKDRARMIDKWVLIAQYCKKRKDQSNCLAIDSALNHFIITGLNLTLKEIKSNTKIIMKEINEYCNLEGNYKVFREQIKNIKRKEFFVPYLGTLLRDFTFLEENGKYLIKGNLINFEKIEKVQKSLDLFFKYKDSVDRVEMERIEDLKFFENLESKSEEELENIANQLEPEFKIREKQLKEKRLNQMDNKYFMNESKRGSCMLNTKTMKISLK